MTIAEIATALTATRRRQRLAFLAALAPFYLAFALGWMFRNPIALFVGAIGLAVLTVAYRAYAPRHAAPLRIDREANPAGDE